MLVTRARSLLGWALFVVAMLGAVVVLCDCAPAEEPAEPQDNTACNLQGFVEKSVRGNLRTSFAYGGGDCLCDCEGVPYPFECTITSTGAR